MRCDMKGKYSLVLLLTAAWWISINVPWVQMGERTLTGGELAPVLNLAPAIAAAATFLAMYRGSLKLMSLMTMATALVSAIYTFAENWVMSDAVTLVLEQISGVMNADQHAAGLAIVVTVAQPISGSLAILVAAASIFAFIKPRSPMRELSQDEELPEDSRSLWDEQR